MKDLEFLRRELPGDNDVAESLHRAQVALKRSRGELVDHRTVSGEVEEVSTLHKLKAAISSTGEFMSIRAIFELSLVNYSIHSERKA